MKFTSLKKVYTELDVAYLRKINSHFFSVIFVYFYLFLKRKKEKALNTWSMLENGNGLQARTGDLTRDLLES